MLYTGTNTRIELETGIDLTNAQNPKVRWRRRNESGVYESGEWDANIEDDKVVYTTSKVDLDIAEVWQFQAIVTINQNLFKGRIVTVKIEKPITTEE